MAFSTYYASHGAALDSLAEQLKAAFATEAGPDEKLVGTTILAMGMAARALRDAGNQLDLAAKFLDEVRQDNI